jgi:hypothetical protein
MQYIINNKHHQVSIFFSIQYLQSTSIEISRDQGENEASSISIKRRKYIFPILKNEE